MEMTDMNESGAAPIDPRSIKVPKASLVSSQPSPASGGAPPGPPAQTHSQPLVALDDSTPAGGARAPGRNTAVARATPTAPAPQTWSAVAELAEVLTNKAASTADRLKEKRGRLVVDQYGVAYVVLVGGGNPYLLRIGSGEFLTVIRQARGGDGEPPSKAQLVEFAENLKVWTEMHGERVDVWRRVGRSSDGTLTIALCDDTNTHISISAGKVAPVATGSDVLFARPPYALPMAMPADGAGNYKLLRGYLNLVDSGFTLYLAWLTYTLAHPKDASSKYLHLVFNGGQGVGKSLAARMTLRLMDPSRVGLQVMSKNVGDLAIAGQSVHLLAFDNVRGFTAAMSDYLCVASTGGDVSKRQLYTDADQHVLRLHFAVILNGIPSFVEQPDLAQRCLTLRLQPMPESKRRSEAAMWADFERDLPAIQKGLFELIAQILAKLPDAQITDPARMVDFSRWLAALELVHGLPQHGPYQAQYVDALNEGQLDSLRENVLASALMDAVDRLTKDGAEQWIDTPAELLTELERHVSTATQRSRDWPANPIALSKRLQVLQAAFMSQGVEIEFRRGKEREIGIKKTGGAS
jgi:hypothetical protein